MHWVGSGGEHVMISRAQLDELIVALGPAADAALRARARQLLIELDQRWPSSRTHGVGPSGS